MRANGLLAALAVLVLGGGRAARAEPLAKAEPPGKALTAALKSPAAFEAYLAACAQGEQGGDPKLLEQIGKIEKLEPLVGRPLTEQVHVIGKKARAYVRFGAEGGCAAVPVVGKPAGFARGDFGRGAKNAYVVQSSRCDKWYCPTAISLKTEDDKLVDVAFLEDGCPSGVQADRLALFGTHDSLRVQCWASAGADPDRTDYLLDAGAQPLAVIHEHQAGVAWYQVGSEEQRVPHKLCQARPPYELLVTEAGASPVLTASRKPTEAEYEPVKDKIEWRSGGCESTVIWFRLAYDAAKRRFAPTGKGRVALATKLCSCPKK